MIDQKSWDPSLVKKFSSSNHYKLLNQLRNEVKKYPLNNKKKTSNITLKDSNTDSKSLTNIPDKKNYSLSQNSNNTNETITNKSTVSFNNATNFSIYNQINNNSQKNEIDFSDKNLSNEDSSSISFKDRLNQIDMK